MRDVYKNNIFSTFPCGVVEIHDVKLSQHILFIMNIRFSLKCKSFVYDKVCETKLFYVLKHFLCYFSLILNKVLMLLMSLYTLSVKLNFLLNRERLLFDFWI
jgi:hypothetical protein